MNLDFSSVYPKPLYFDQVNWNFIFDLCLTSDPVLRHSHWKSCSCNPALMIFFSQPAQSPDFILLVHLSQAHSSCMDHSAVSPGSHKKTHLLIFWDPGLAAYPHSCKVVQHVSGPKVSLKWDIFTTSQSPVHLESILNIHWMSKWTFPFNEYLQSYKYPNS